MENTSFENLAGAIVGLGSIGNRHMNNLAALGIKKLFVVRRPDSQNAQFHPAENVQVKNSLAQVLEEGVDFVVVANPSALHAATAIEAIAGGCHVLIEKPLGKNLGEEENRLFAAASETSKVCAMAYCMRYHLAYRKANSCVKDGHIGRVLYAKAWFEGYLPDWHPWEDYKKSYAGLVEQGGGVLRTLDHELDFLNWVLGPAVKAKGQAINTGGIGIEAEDLAMYQLEHSNNLHSQVTTAFCRKPQSRGFCFVGTEGQLVFDWQSGILRLITCDGEERVLEDAGQSDVNHMYSDMMQDFLQDIVQPMQLRSAPIEAGWHSLKLIEQICNESKK